MTFDERVRALASFGLTPRQTRFLATVALHSGFCLRRQYAAFANIEYGKHVREFLDGLVSQNIARRIAYKRNRGFIYQIHAKSVYRAIGEEDNRNRRVTSPALIARKVMLLDLVIALPDVDWFSTEEDKVTLFTTRFNLTRTDVPLRIYEAKDTETPPTTRAFVHKLPIYLAGHPPTPHLVCFADEAGECATEVFLRDHARLLNRLSTWTLVVIGPTSTANFAASERAFQRFVGQDNAFFGIKPSELRWYCQTREAVEAKHFGRLPVADLTRFRDLRRRLARPLVDALYEEWLTSGDAALARFGPASAGSRFPNARFETRVLPFRYDQFGDLPGVC